MKLSIPKPTSEMLPATIPETSAITPSSVFRTMVKYSSLRPRSTTVGRSKALVCDITAVYTAQVPPLLIPNKCVGTLKEVRVVCPQATERPSQQVHSRTENPEHLSNACRQGTKSLRPSRTPFERSNPASAEEEFGLHEPSIPLTRRASGPRTGELGRPGFVRECCHSVVASPLGGSVPTRRAPAPFGRCAALTVAELRRPPADKSVKSATAATLSAEPRSRHQTLSRTPRDFLPKVSQPGLGRAALGRDPTGIRRSAARELPRRRHRSGVFFSFPGKPVCDERCNFLRK